MANEYYPLKGGKEYYCPIDGEKLAHPIGASGYHVDWYGLVCCNCRAYYSTNQKEHRKEALKYLRQIKTRIRTKKEEFQRELQSLEKIIGTARENGLLK